MNWPMLILFFGIWLYVMNVFRRKKQSFFFFFLGSVGMFAFLFILFEPILTAPLAQMVCYLTGGVGKVTGMFSAFASYGVLFIEECENGPVSLYVDFECAGLVEILVFVSLLAFFQAYKWYEKIVVGVISVISIISANIVRLSIICIMIHFMGNDIYYFAHTIVGRIVFYLFAINLYFYVFTRRQIKAQRVGEFEYNDKAD